MRSSALIDRKLRNFDGATTEDASTGSVVKTAAEATMPFVKNVTETSRTLQATLAPLKVLPLYGKKTEILRKKVLRAKDVIDFTVAPPRDNRITFSLDGSTYPFIISPRDACKTPPMESLDFVSLIISGSGNFLDRRTVRETWATPRRNARFFFLLGTPKDATVQAQIEAESEKYGDLVQADFVDTYRNLTLKTIMGLRWASLFCNSAPYLFKTDDDTFAHVPNLMRYMRKIGQKSNFIVCRANADHRPEHDEDSKWYVSEEQFNETFYPVYCSGAGYIMSLDVVTSLYDAATRTPSIPIEDAYTTGILTREIGIKPRMNLAFGYEKECDGINVWSLRQAFQWIFTYTGHASDGVVKFQHTMWKLANFRSRGGYGSASQMQIQAV